MTENCSRCHRSNTLVRNKRTYWYRTKEGKRLCRWCYLKTIANPKMVKKRMKFKGKLILFPFSVRIGQCFIIGCTETETDRHHFDYVRCMPIAMTVELCDIHHQIENKKQETMQHMYSFDWDAFYPIHFQFLLLAS